MNVKLPIPFQQIACRYEEVKSHGDALYEFIANPENHKYKVINKDIWPDGMIEGYYHATPHYALEVESWMSSSKLQEQYRNEF